MDDCALQRLMKAVSSKELKNVLQIYGYYNRVINGTVRWYWPPSCFACYITNFFPLTVVYAWRQCLDLNKEQPTSVH